jgi:hypothetical protein
MSNAIFILPAEVDGQQKRLVLTEIVCTVCLGIVTAIIAAFLVIGWIDSSLTSLGF